MFKNITDRESLLGLLTLAKQAPQILFTWMLRWTILLNEYIYILVHRPGTDIELADTLSRLPLAVPKFVVPPRLEVL